MAHDTGMIVFDEASELPADLWWSPRDQIIDNAATAMAAKKECAIRESLSAFWPAWTLNDVKARCRIERVAGSPVETLYADGVPILEFGPIESELVQTETGWVYRLTQNYRDLRR